MEKQIYIKKGNDELELFSFDKLKNSLQSAGASKDVIETILLGIQPNLYDGMSSNEIYKKAFAILKKHNKISASRYSLKRALFDLGHTGFPFERLVAAILSIQKHFSPTHKYFKKKGQIRSNYFKLFPDTKNENILFITSYKI